eukprot:2032518-Pyramimonas_sp.AAC.1
MGPAASCSLSLACGLSAPLVAALMSASAGRSTVTQVGTDVKRKPASPLAVTSTAPPAAIAAS